MDTSILKKRLNTFRSSKGYFTKISDEVTIEVALSKYCDLIPIERYVQVGSRNGINGLPANTLIEGTHNLSGFLLPVYEKIKEDAA